MIGQAAWDVAWGHGSFVTIEFGAPVTNSEQPDKRRGTWHFWVYCCAWRLETPDDVLAYSEDDRSRLEKVLPLLEGAVLEGVEMNFAGGRYGVAVCGAADVAVDADSRRNL